MQSMFISSPSVAFQALLQACHESLTHAVTEGINSTIKNLSDTERFLTILAAIRDPKAKPGFPPNLLNHASFSILTFAPMEDTLDLVEVCSGMPITHAPTKLRNMLMVVTTGTLSQWRDAVVTGTEHSEFSIREGFNEIHNLFVQANLNSVWNDFEQKPQSDGTYKLIEYRP
jgi:hypothetical protein